MMTWEELRRYCLSKPGAWPDKPWEDDLVAKVHDRIFAFLGSGSSPSIGIKAGASREEADEWLVRYPAEVSVMSHIGRSGWNTLRIDGVIPDAEIREAIDASYDAIVAKLAHKHRPPEPTRP